MVMAKEKQFRSKKFMSTDSLWYEEERLNTFIDWPVTFIAAHDLAANGFYYLRTKDHCACAFCLGIIGAWERGDSIIGEHKRHFPHCPLLNGHTTPNVPLMHGNIIAELNRKAIRTSEKHLQDNSGTYGEDVCGTGREDGLHLQKNNVVEDETSSICLTRLGLPLYSGPKKKEYLTYESRLSTYKDWPDKVTVTPQDLADAGFFYIGLSDHVRCFHCGNGLRNWEPNDNAWEEHARWYPECHFILCKKGIEFVDKVKRTKPPYAHAPPNEPSVYFSKGAKYNKFEITDEELSRLMGLQMIKSTSEMGFSENAIKAALKRKLEQTGVPFFSIDQCIEAVLQVPEEEKQAVIDESLLNQSRKMTMYENFIPPVEREAVQPESNPSNDLPPSPARESASTQVSPARDLQQDESVPSTSQIVPTTSVENDTEMVPFEEGNAVTEVIDDSSNEGLSNTQPEIDEDVFSSLQRIEKHDAVLAEADEIIKVTKILLGKDSLSSSGHSSLESLTQLEDLPNGNLKNSVIANDLTKELERLKDERTCRVCMDTEMEVVFLPCTHMTACSSCAVTLSKCPICRGSIQYIIKPIIS